MTQVSEPQARTLNTDNIKYIDVDGIRTRYYEGGQGEPLILLYGGAFGEGSLATWGLNLPGLEEKFHVFALDKLGQGHTDNPKRDEDYTFDAVVEHAAAWAKAVGISQAHVLGHSRGALLAAALVFRVPGLAKTVVFGNSNTLAPDDERWPAFVFYSELQKRLPAGPPTKESLRMAITANSYSGAHITDDYLNHALESALLPKTQVARAKMADIKGTGTGNEIGRSTFLPSMARVKADTLRRIDEEGLPAPTLMFWGVNDPSAKLPLAFLLYGRISATTPNAQLHVFNQAGHSTYREHPDEVNQLLKWFCLS